MNNLLEPSRVEILKQKEAQALKDAKTYRQEIDDIVRTCNHIWGDTEYFPEKVNTFDPPPYEKDYYGAGWVPSPYLKRESRFWLRKCRRCGLVQRTELTKLVDGGNGLRREVPEFGGK